MVLSTSFFLPSLHSGTDRTTPPPPSPLVAEEREEKFCGDYDWASPNDFNWVLPRCPRAGRRIRVPVQDDPAKVPYRVQEARGFHGLLMRATTSGNTIDNSLGQAVQALS